MTTQELIGHLSKFTPETQVYTLNECGDYCPPDVGTDNAHFDTQGRPVWCEKDHGGGCKWCSEGAKTFEVLVLY